MDELRDTLKTDINSNIEILDGKLSKIKLANKLNCLVEELTTLVVDCPQSKLGTIIGKNGTMMKQLCDKCNVTMDVQKENDGSSKDRSKSITKSWISSLIFVILCHSLD